MFKFLKITLIGLIITFFSYLFLYPLIIPIEHLKKENPKVTAMMKYRLKQWKKEGKKIQIKQIWVPLSKVSPYLIKAVLIGEDDKFFKHEGFDFEAIQKALEKNLQARKIKYGGSTISQQIAKNLFLNPSKSPVRKIQEAILTWRLERALSKKRILEIYLNIAEWGEGIFGIEAASRYYFGKPASALTPWEAVRLAAVLPNPIKYNPLKDSSYVNKRANLIYSIMKKRGIIKEEYKDIEKKVDRSNREKAPVNKERSPEESIQTPGPESKSPDSS